MKKGTKVFAFIIFSLFIISFLVGVVEAKTVLDAIKESTAGLFSTPSENSSLYFSKVLLIILVTLLVYSISAALPFVPDSNGIRWAISVIIGLLSFMTVSLDNIKYILVNYEGLGVALTTFIPLVILLIFTAEFRNKDKTGLAGPINKLILVLFALYIGFRWLTVEYTGDIAPTMAWAYPATLIIVLLWLLIEKAFAKWFKKEKITAQAESAEAQIDEAAAGIANAATINKKLTGAAKAK